MFFKNNIAGIIILLYLTVRLDSRNEALSTNEQLYTGDPMTRKENSALHYSLDVMENMIAHIIHKNSNEGKRHYVLAIILHDLVNRGAFVQVLETVEGDPLKFSLWGLITVVAITTLRVLGQVTV